MSNVINYLDHAGNIPSIINNEFDKIKRNNDLSGYAGQFIFQNGEWYWIDANENKRHLTDYITGARDPGLCEVTYDSSKTITGTGTRIPLNNIVFNDNNFFEVDLQNNEINAPSDKSGRFGLKYSPSITVNIKFSVDGSNVSSDHIEFALVTEKEFSTEYEFGNQQIIGDSSNSQEFYDLSFQWSNSKILDNKIHLEVNTLDDVTILPGTKIIIEAISDPS